MLTTRVLDHHMTEAKGCEEPGAAFWPRRVLFEYSQN